LRPRSDDEVDHSESSTSSEGNPEYVR